MNPASAAVWARDLVKRYAGVEAVRGISFGVGRGQAVALLGPNGAGKSTTMRMVACLARPSGGELLVLGEPAHPEQLAIKRRIGVVSQDDYLDPGLTAEENVAIYARLYGWSGSAARRRSRDALAFMDLTEQAGQPVRVLSGGMRRRLAIARGLVGGPELLVLDEPSTGLDPTARRQLWGRLRQLIGDGVTLFFSTHYMDEAERLADWVVLMEQGRLLDQGSPAALIARWAAPEVVEVDDALPPEWLAEWVSRRGLGRVESQAGRLWIFTAQAEAVLTGLAQQGYPLRAYRRRPGNLEDVWVGLFRQAPAAEGVSR